MPGIALHEIVELDTPVAIAGAIRTTEATGDQVFEYLIAIAMLVYEMTPG
ncbi:hypothetical protein [Sphingomonas sp. VNH70]